MKGYHYLAFKVKVHSNFIVAGPRAMHVSNKHFQTWFISEWRAMACIRGGQ